MPCFFMPIFSLKPRLASEQLTDLFEPMEEILKLRSRLPAVKAWIHDVLNDNRHNCVFFKNLNYPGIKKTFPDELLGKAKVVYVDGKVPVPPLGAMGLSEFAEFEQMPVSGITYDDTVFIDQGAKSEGLHFHELVHVVQWQRLGFDNFLLAYGIGVFEFGYANSPFEKMAYALQRLFESDELPRDVLGFINRKTDAIWSRTEKALGAISNNEKPLRF